MIGEFFFILILFHPMCGRMKLLPSFFKFSTLPSISFNPFENPFIFPSALG